MSEQEPYTITTAQAKAIARDILRRHGNEDEDRHWIRAALADLWDLPEDEIDHHDCDPVAALIERADVRISFPRTLRLKQDPYRTRDQGETNHG